MGWNNIDATSSIHALSHNCALKHSMTLCHVTLAGLARYHTGLKNNSLVITQGMKNKAEAGHSAPGTCSTTKSTAQFSLQNQRAPLIPKS